MTIRRNQPLALPEGDLGTVVSAGMTEAVVSPDAFRDLPQQPIHYSVEVADQHHRITLTPAASPASIPSDPLKSKLLRTNKVIRANGALYVGRCSARYSACTIANIRMGEVWQNARSLLYGFLATGTTAGITCATALLLSGSKGRTHTTQLKRAILMGKLSVAYQPIVELGSRRIVGAEALARWTDEEGDSIRPETILALAEAEGFVSEITRFVITRSLRELRPIFVNDPEFRLSVNLAPSDLTDPRLLMLLDEKLSNGPITSNNLAFELPERATLEREIAIRAIQRLRDRGHAVYIDEFGTGYSNLTYLSELNVDGIKINRSFIATLGTESVTASIVPQILAVADALDLKVVVQGIEREEQANYFASDNPGMLAQGWFFGLPVSARSLLFLCEGKSE
jgi:sensor c-di-GMP phosphodiesterase-like protein